MIPVHTPLTLLTAKQKMLLLVVLRNAANLKASFARPDCTHKIVTRIRSVNIIAYALNADPSTTSLTQAVTAITPHLATQLRELEEVSKEQLESVFKSFFILLFKNTVESNILPPGPAALEVKKARI